MKYFTKRWNLYKGKQRLNLLENEVARLYVNRELIAFLQNLTDLLKSNGDKQYYLLFCKKVILQANRLPDGNHYGAFKEEYDEFFEDIKDEQAIFDPVKWIDAELDFLKLEDRCKDRNTETKDSIDAPPPRDWMTFGEMMHRLGTSKMALRRRMAEGMPFIKLGNQLRFEPKSVDAWLIAQN